MGSSSSHITVPTTTDWMIVTDLAENGKLRLGDIIEFANGVFGIVTSLPNADNNDHNVITVMNGTVQEVPLYSVCYTARKNNFYDDISTAYAPRVILKNARDNIGKHADDSKSFVKLCRNGV
uniref:Methylase_S domain-containing protein n=1 Tax=Panagrellus redivivus TaxID=6233 RepID=A0A7E4W0S7_PANRE